MLEKMVKLERRNKIIIPVIKKLKKKNININGPFSADSILIKKI